MPGTSGGERRVLESLELELVRVVSCMGVEGGTQTLVPLQEQQDL